MNCDRVGCEEKWEYKVNFDGIPVFYFCKKHYFPAIDFVLRDICPISSETVGEKYPYSIGQYKRDAFLKNKKSLLNKEKHLKDAIKRADNTISHKRAVREYEKRKSDFAEARRVLSL